MRLSGTLLKEFIIIIVVVVIVIIEETFENSQVEKSQIIPSKMEV